MKDETVCRYVLARTDSRRGGRAYHPGKLEARVMRHPGRRARVLIAFRNVFGDQK